MNLAARAQLLLRPMGRRGLLLLPAGGVLLAVFLLPVARLFVESFRASDGAWPRLTHYGDVLSNSFFWDVLGRTLLLGIVVTGLCVILGLPLAWAYIRARGWRRAALLFVIAAPLLINMVVRVYGWTILLGPGGFSDWAFHELGVSHPPKLMYNLTGVVIGMVHVFLPFMVLSLVPPLARIERELYEAAATLGASRLRLHRTVTMPLARNGIATGSVLVFALTQGAFVTPLVLGGTSVQVVATLVYTDTLVLFDRALATALAVILLVIVLAVVAIQLRLGRTKWAR